MPSISVDDGSVQLHYSDAGTGRATVVLLHGFPFTSEMWDPQIRALSHKYRLIAPDLRGFGQTELSPGPYSMARLADDVAELIAALGRETVVIAGLSMGGYVAFELYKRHADRVAAVILSDTRPEPDSVDAMLNRTRIAERARQEGCAAIADELLPRLLAPGTLASRPRIVEGLRAMMASANPEAVAAALAAMASRADSRPLLSHIAVPTLVTGGTEDSLTPPVEIRAWAARIPTASVEFIEAAGHVSNLEQPAQFNATVSRFLDVVLGDCGEKRIGQ